MRNRSYIAKVWKTTKARIDGLTVRQTLNRLPSRPTPDSGPACIPTVLPSRRQVYNRVKNIMIPNMYYREDIGDRWNEEDSDRLHAWGYLRE